MLYILSGCCATDDAVSAQPLGRRSYRIDRWQVDEFAPSDAVHANHAVTPPSKVLNRFSFPSLRDDSNNFNHNRKIATLYDLSLISVCHFTTDTRCPPTSLPESPIVESFSQSTMEFSSFLRSPTSPHSAQSLPGSYI